LWLLALVLASAGFGAARARERQEDRGNP